MIHRNELEGTLELLNCLNNSGLGVLASFAEQDKLLVLSIADEKSVKNIQKFKFKPEEIADFTPGQFVEYVRSSINIDTEITI